MPERHRGEPVDADVDVLRAVLAPGEVELAAARREVARHGERSRTGADAGDLLAVRFSFLGKPSADVVLVVRGHSLQAADRDRLGLGVVLFLDAAAAARGLAGPVARAPEDAG